MSKYEVLRLNGCDVTKYLEQPDYPHCEDYDLPSVELSFAKSPISFETNNKDFNWATPGDCARLNTEVANGKGFNGRPLEGCELSGKFAGTIPRLSSTTRINDKVDASTSKAVPIGLPRDFGAAASERDSIQDTTNRVGPASASLRGLSGSPRKYPKSSPERTGRVLFKKGDSDPGLELYDNIFLSEMEAEVIADASGPRSGKQGKKGNRNVVDDDEIIDDDGITDDIGIIDDDGIIVDDDIIGDDGIDINDDDLIVSAKSAKRGKNRNRIDEDDEVVEANDDDVVLVNDDDILDVNDDDILDVNDDDILDVIDDDIFNNIVSDSKRSKRGKNSKRRQRRRKQGKNQKKGKRRRNAPTPSPTQSPAPTQSPGPTPTLGVDDDALTDDDALALAGTPSPTIAPSLSPSVRPSLVPTQQDDT
jgi:hypothetical protein